MSSRPVLALLDGYSLAYRAFYALPDDLRTTTGQITNAVYGFTSMVIKLLDEHRPDGIATVFDRGRPSFRLEALPDYKANRSESPDEFKSQLPLIDEVLTALAIPRLDLAGHEADDLIASYARAATAEGWDVLVVTGDRDLFQLVDEHVKVLYTRRGISDTVLMDAAAVEERYGVAPARYPLLAALRGDTSDNIPGVPGVGDKTAAKLIADYGDLEGIYAHLGELRGKKVPAALAEHRAAVEAGLVVATAIRDLQLPVPCDELRMGRADRDAVRELFATLEFRSLWERLRELLLDEREEAAAGGFDVEPHRLRAGGAREWLASLPAGQPLVVLPRLEGRLPDLTVTAVALAAAGANPVVAVREELSGEDLDALRAALGDHSRPLVVHDGKRVRHAATDLGADVAGVTLDTELAAYLIDPETRGYDLERLALTYLNKQLVTEEELGEEPAQLSMDVSDADPWLELALRAQAVLDVGEVLEGEIVRRGHRDLLEEIELPLVPVLAALERTGIAVDLAVLSELADTLGDRVEAAKQRAFQAVGSEFNLDSPKQLQELLFVELRLPRTKRIKTGWSTDAAELSKIVDVHPVIEPILAYREVSKLKGTYVDALPPLVNPRTGRIHAEFNQTVAVTGRLSSQNPNMQNIPIRTELGRQIRRAFVPGERYAALLVADYSQIELRVMAHLSADDGLLAAFHSGEDIHAQTAAMVWGIPISDVDNARRSKIKGMTYGLAYGLSAYGLSQQLSIPREEARELMDAYFERFPGVRDFLYGGVEDARRSGYTETLTGRRRYLPDLMSDNRQRRAMAERMALNAPIQGTAADIFKLAMIAVFERMRGMSSQLLLQVHDELVCETTTEEHDTLRELLVDTMSGVMDLSVPLEVDTASGPSWAEAEKH